MKKLVILFTLLLIFQLHAQSVNFNLSGAGARASGMGGAFIGVADDATAIVWNPAGLTLLERPEFSVVSRLVSDSYSFEIYEDKYEQTQTHFLLNFISGAFPLKLENIKLVTAMAFQRQIDLFSTGKYDTYDGEVEYEGNGGVDSFTFGGGLQVLPWFNAGIAANLWMGDYKYTENYRADSEYNENYSGFNLVLGGMIDLNGLDSPIPLKLGTTFRTPFDLEIESKDDWGEETDIFKMPGMLGLGASFRPSDLFTLAIDYEMRYYSEVDFPFDMNQLRMGAEYLLVGDFAVIPLRAGFFTHPTFMVDENADQIMGVGVSVGSGLIFERFALDVSLSGNEVSIDYDNDINETISQAIFAFSAIIYF